jgi:solute carrier family 6 noradrenalin transporter-like protein 2
MGGLECVITGVMDEFKEFFHRKGISREIFTGVVVFSSFLVAITCVTPASTSNIINWQTRYFVFLVE